MSTNYRIRKPYVLATLPRPFNHETGRFHVGDVFGHSLEQPRKKRTEVIAAIDGESVNMYDITSSSLITSHPVSPEQTFSCAPVSLRLRLPSPDGTIRFTYAVTRTGASKPKQRLTCFIDSVSFAGKATTVTVSAPIPTTSPIVHLDASTVVAAAAEKSNLALKGPCRFDGNLIAVAANGEVFCFHPDADLSLRWSLSAVSLAQDEVNQFSSLSIEAASLIPAGDAIDGLFAGDAFTVESAFSRSLPPAAKARADVLVLVTTAHRGKASPERLLVALAVNPASVSTETAPPLVRLLVSRLPEPPRVAVDAARSFKLHVQSGSLAMLADETLFVYTISSAIPRLAATMARPGASSILRLTNHSMLTASVSWAAVVNPVFGSVQASIALDLAAFKEAKSKVPLQFELLSAFKRVNLVIGRVADRLVALPVEQPRLAGKKRTAEGLLVDSIGRGGPRDPLIKRARIAAEDEFFAAPLPGTATEEYVKTLGPEMVAADELLAKENVRAFDALLAPHFGLEVGAEGEWLIKNGYPLADRRWVLYTLSRVFALDEPAATEDTEEEAPADAERLPELRVLLPGSNALAYLAEAGHLTLRNVRAAFRAQLETQVADVPDAHIAKAIVKRLVEIDPGMELLAGYIGGNKLTAVELLAAILVLMQSLGFLGDAQSLAITEGEIESPISDETMKEADVQLQLELLERDLQTTESYLEGSGEVRNRAMNEAFGKLAGQSAAETVAGLRAVVTPTEVLALIRVLRGELLRGAWTTRYLDQSFEEYGEEDGEGEGAQAESLALLADLLSRCIDAVGMLGWMVHDGFGGVDASDVGDFLGALKLEVSAALEGLEECVMLEGLVAGAVRHADVLRKQAALRVGREARVEKEVVVGTAAMLPLGGGEVESGWKVGKGGEVVMRSHRELEHLLSKGTRVYSLEKLQF